METPTTKRRAKRTPDEMTEEAKRKATGDFAILAYQVVKCLALVKDQDASPKMRECAQVELQGLLPRYEKQLRLVEALGFTVTTDNQATSEEATQPEAPTC